jgi:hypothetical protein
LLAGSFVGGFLFSDVVMETGWLAGWGGTLLRVESGVRSLGGTKRFREEEEAEEEVEAQSSAVRKGLLFSGLVGC